MALTADQIEKTKKLVASIWNQNIADSLDYNEEVEEVVRQAVEALGNCNQSINYFFLGIAGAASGAYVVYGQVWLRDFALDLARAIMDNKSTGWVACVNTVAANYRSALEMASLGI